MNVQQFLLAMNFARIILMVASIMWLLWTPRESRIRTVMLAVCIAMLCSNLVNAVISVGILKVSLW